MHTIIDRCRFGDDHRSGCRAELRNPWHYDFIGSKNYEVLDIDFEELKKK
jgi:hypothetical protein